LQNKKKQEPLKVEPLHVLLTGQQDAILGILPNYRESCVLPFYACDIEVGSFKEKEGEEEIAGPFKWCG
jgi:hypothetical protein